MRGGGGGDLDGSLFLARGGGGSYYHWEGLQWGGGGGGVHWFGVEASPPPPPHYVTLEGFAFAFCTIATKSFLEKCHSYQPSFRMLSFDLCIMKAVLMVDIVVVRGARMAERKGEGGAGWLLQAAS